jgi:formamidopyrimidine-DNA glycosylase
MFELPEYTTLARQMNETLAGKNVLQGTLGNSPHKFVWYNRTNEDFQKLTLGKKVGQAKVHGRWLTLDLEPGYRMLLGECGGKILYHPPEAGLPPKYHLSLVFYDGSSMTCLTSMWGAMELYETGLELERQYIKDMRPTPVDAKFTFSYFSGLIDELISGEKRSVKSLLTQEQLIPGLGNAIAQDILFKAKLHPHHPLANLAADQRRDLHKVIIQTVGDVTRAGGRHDEFDLFGQLGGYTRLMDSHSVGNPCPVCGCKVEKIQYLGGACYFCSHCQV